MISVAIAGVERIYQPGYRYNKAGVIVLDICSQDQFQQAFFGKPYGERQKAAMAVVDGINSRYGKGTIKIAAVGLRQQWKMRCGNRSQRYTTRWSELPVVLA